MLAKHDLREMNTKFISQITRMFDLEFHNTNLIRRINKLNERKKKSTYDFQRNIE